MSKLKHTAGDWSADGPYIVALPPNRKRDLYLAEIVASDETGRFEKDFDKRCANAQLMAAAPDMVKALRLARFALDRNIGDAPLIEDTEAYDAVTTALAKAGL